MISASRNQLMVAKNSFQGKDLKALCVCSGGVLRSPTLANALHKEFGFNTRACGSSEEYALIPISEALIAWADIIVFVNPDNFHEAVFHNRPLEKIIEGKAILLNIEDDYEYNNPVLVRMLLQQFSDEWNGDKK